MNTVLQGQAPHSPPVERQARVQLAACCRVFDLLGWTEMIYHHITVRLADSVAGDKPDDSPLPVNPAGFTAHAATHEAIAQAHCVMRTHTTYQA